MMHKQPIEQADLFRMKWLDSADLSPDGAHAVYALAEYDAEQDKDFSNLWLVNVASGNQSQLTYGKAVNKNPRWSPDGSAIAFMSDRNGEKAQLFRMPVGIGEARQLTNLKQGVTGGPEWSPDGATLAFTAGKSREKDFDQSDPYRITRNIIRFDAIGYVDRMVQDVWTISAEGGEPTQLTDHDRINSEPRWSPDGSLLLYSFMLEPDTFNGISPGLAIVDLQKNGHDIINSDWGYGITGCWHPDGEHVVYCGTPATKPLGSKSDLYVIGIGGGEPENRTPSLPMGVGGRLSADMPAPLNRTNAAIVPTADGRAAFVQIQRGGTVEIARVALSGPESVDVVLGGNRAHKLLGISRDQRQLFYTVSSFTQTLDLYLADIEGENVQKLTGTNDELLSQRYTARVEHLLYPSIDGVQAEGWLVMPENHEAPYPTILYIHGGPHGAFGHQYHFDTQMFLGAGYAVLLVNHRASTGYDDSFSTAIKGDWGNLDYQDLMYGVDEGIARGLIDADRMGVCGLSGGGNLSCWIVGQTDRFKAAVPENPVTNWVSFYGVSDIGVWFALEELGGHPHEIPEIYRKCSPITYAHRCTTPTLMVQGEHDWRCPAEQSEQFYTVLKANGCVVEMLRLPNSPHGGTIAGAPKIRRAHNEALLNWMNRYVLGEG